MLEACRGKYSVRLDAETLERGSWIQVGTLFENASWLPVEGRAAHIRNAGAIIRKVIGERAWTVGHSTDPDVPNDDASLDGRIRCYCELVEDEGGFELAEAILLAYLESATEVAEIERGRIEAVRARLAWKQGAVDVARERYTRVGHLARRLASPELKARALIGHANVARLRGNLPLARARGRAAVSVAQRGRLTRLASVAHQTIVASYALSGDYEAAIEHGWKAYELANGDIGLEAAALGNIGQAFLDLGHPATAAAAFRAVIGRQPYGRILLPALSGLAVASLRLGHVEVLPQVEAEIDRRTASTSTAYDAATALLELSRAYVLINDVEKAKDRRGRALVIATLHGFHQIAFDAEEPIVDAPPPRSLPERVERVATEVRQLTTAGYSSLQRPWATL